MGTPASPSAGGGKGAEDDTFSASKVQAKLHHSIRLCSAAAKKAKVFELQRSIKKLKIASADEQDALRQEVEALKSLEVASIAALALKTKLIKSSLLPRSKGEISDDELRIRFPLVHLASELTSTTQDNREDRSPSEQRARSKLSSNKLLAEEVSKSVAKIEALVRNRPTVYAKDGGKSKPETSKLRPPQDIKGKFEGGEEEPSLSADSEDSTADEVQVDRSEGMKTGPSKDGILKRKTHPSAIRDETISRKMAKSVEGRERRTEAEVESNTDSDVMHDDDDEEEEEEEEGEEYEEEEEEKEEAGEEGSGAEERQSLPALSTGFVAGRGFNLGRDSDDEWSDGDADADSIDEDVDKKAGGKEGRKNRMGQRARRAIWEKKFGKGANHLKLREKEPKRAATTFTDRKGNVVKLPPSDSGWRGALAKEAPRARPPPARTSTSSTKTPATEAEMHPSWLAKQQQKARQEAALGSATAVAKKIVFD